MLLSQCPQLGLDCLELLQGAPGRGHRGGGSGSGGGVGASHWVYLETKDLQGDRGGGGRQGEGDREGQGQGDREGDRGREGDRRHTI